MDKPGYTPGPWHVVPYGDGNALVICTEPDGNWRICFLATPGDSSGAWETIKADARLIAAAPDLVEALKDTLRILDAVRLSAGLGKGQVERMDRARAALSKATGGSHEQG